MTNRCRSSVLRRSSIVLRRPPPLVFKDAVQQRVPPATLEPLVLAQTPFLPHADLLQDVRRSDILREAVCGQAMQPQHLEAGANDGARGLGRVAASPFPRCQLVADVGFARIDGAHPQADVADESILFWQ